jgi:xanthine dehydrogenase accessory factor
MKRIPDPAEVLAEAERSLHSQGRVVLCQIVRAEGSTPGKAGWKMLARPDGSTFGNLGGGAFEALVKRDALARLSASGPVADVKRYYFTETAVRGEPTGMVCGGMTEVFLERIEAAPVLVICGGGPVGQALAQAGRLAGFDPLVAEDRAEFRDAGLFPGGTRFAAVDREYGEPFLEPVRGRDLYVAVVTRCWDTDVAALQGVLRQEPPRLRYLGLMGSLRKVARVREEVGGRGFDLGRLRAPIGLPIGGDTPGEIAISVMAEIQKTRYEKDGDVQDQD